VAGARSPGASNRHDRRRLRKPIVGHRHIFTQFVPGHVHLRNMGALVADAVVPEAGGWARFQYDRRHDGIAMGHGSCCIRCTFRDLIADAVRVLVTRTALTLCLLSTVTRSRQGMAAAALRLEHPTVFRVLPVPWKLAYGRDRGRRALAD